MILAEKIIRLRKQNGWSQEELAMQMEVSRQSVSKWESGSAIPDLNKILKLSALFGVSTDYLLKDEIEEAEGTVTELAETGEDQGRQVSVEEAGIFMETVRSGAGRFAGAVSACILSPVTLILLGGLSEEKHLISDNMAAGLGVIILLLMVAAAVGVFISTGMRLENYKYLEEETIFVQYGVESITEKKKEEFLPVYRNCLVTGIALCILSVIPLMVAVILGGAEFVMICCTCMLLLIVSGGVFLLVWSGVIYGSFQKLLQEGDYTKEKKEENRKNAHLSQIYWCSVTAVYLGISFVTRRWDMTWIVWPCAGVFFAALCGIAAVVRGSRS